MPARVGEESRRAAAAGGARRAAARCSSSTGAPGLLDQPVVADARRAARDAGHAAEAAVEVLDDCRAERERPVEVCSISWMRPRGESISSLQRTYVGHVGRQKPQWTQSPSASSSITRRAPLPGRTRLADRRAATLRVASRAGRPRGPAPGRRRLPRRGGRRPRRASRGRLARSPGRSGAGRAPRPAARAPRSTHGVGLDSPPTSARASRAAPRPPRRGLRRAPRRGRGGGRRARSAGAASASSARTTPAASSVSTTSVAAAAGSGWRRRRDARDQRERPVASRRRACRGRSPRRSSRPCRPRSRSCRRASTSVTPRTRSRGVPKRWRSGPESRAREAGADRRVAGWVEREPLARARERVA